MSKPFITVYMPIAGWKAIMYSWNPEGFYEPEETGYWAYRTKAEAINEAKTWAEDTGIEFQDNDPDNTADAPDKSVTEQLLEIFPDMVVVNLNDETQS